MKGSERAPVGTLLAAPGAVVSFALLGLGALLLLPELAPVLPVVAAGLLSLVV